jgi:hypothetical protein
MYAGEVVRGFAGEVVIMPREAGYLARDCRNRIYALA